MGDFTPFDQDWPMEGRVMDIHEKNKWEYCLAHVFNLCKKFVFVLLHVIFLSRESFYWTVM